MQSNQQEIFDSLKDEGPQAWCEYLRPFEEGETVSSLNMQVIFHYAAPLAKELGNLEWAEVAVRAAELEARNQSGIGRENAELSAMQTRALFISKMGSDSNHFVLDKAIILRWALNQIEIQVQTAKEKALSIRKELDSPSDGSNKETKQRLLQDLSLLRRIKHRLNIVKMLADSGELPEGSQLYEWLEILDQLP